MNPVKLYEIGDRKYVVARPTDYAKFCRSNPFLMLFRKTVTYIDAAGTLSALTYQDSRYFSIQPAFYLWPELMDMLLSPPKIPLTGRNYERHNYVFYGKDIGCNNPTMNYNYESWEVWKQVLRFLHSTGHIISELPDRMFCTSGTTQKWSIPAVIAYHLYRKDLQTLAQFTAP